ncbi:hypothetical protein VRK_26390 [Vibrio sp. MEBiC08052]|nr:hypothetical protein VRK_26390 [Vibrio sp. MEBiC08052]
MHKSIHHTISNRLLPEKSNAEYVTSITHFSHKKAVYDDTALLKKV